MWLDSKVINNWKCPHFDLKPLNLNIAFQGLGSRVMGRVAICQDDTNKYIYQIFLDIVLILTFAKCFVCHLMVISQGMLSVVLVMVEVSKDSLFGVHPIVIFLLAYNWRLAILNRSGWDSMIVKIIKCPVFLSYTILPANCSLQIFCIKPQIHWGFLHKLFK